MVVMALVRRRSQILVAEQPAPERQPGTAV
jgi:hypothetical protein